MRPADDESTLCRAVVRKGRAGRCARPRQRLRGVPFAQQGALPRPIARNRSKLNGCEPAPTSTEQEEAPAMAENDGKPPSRTALSDRRHSPERAD
ncbi:hypothetical protein B5F40_05435 [Gordonibacter sp. An230]|nr:hypothetical protein B5F40_05435 [Gordonibacter sp. An230]